METFKVGFLQYPVIYCNCKENLDYIESKIRNETFDLLVLPELFTSGYAFDDPVDIVPYVEILSKSSTIAHLQDLARQTGGMITGTIPELYGKKIYNTAILVDKDGLIGSQRKIHLTTYEKRIFEAGKEAKVIEAHGVKIGLVTCFDIWFAPLTSKLKQEGVEIICNSSCFGGDVTPNIIPIRGLENQNYVISCNRIGAEAFDGVEESYYGNSQIVDPDGKVLFRADKEEQLYFVNIDLNRVNHPTFGSQICADFKQEHEKYGIRFKVGKK